MKTSFFCRTFLSGVLLLLAISVPYYSLAQNLKEIKGVVRSRSEGSLLSGVSVIVKGSNRGTSTNQDGKYNIRAQSSDILVFSFQGFKAYEELVGEKTTINVELFQTEAKMDEVLVVGYGTTKRRDLTGSVSSVKLSDVNKAPVASYVEALAGRVAGVQVSAQDGQPGTDMNIVIRGANSLTQSNSPLYVIDGFPIENPENAALNPEDIESISILKDASSTAIYGSRAANGVVIIETKKGKIGKPVITFNSSVGFQQLRKKMDLMSPYEFVKYQQERDPVGTDSIYFTNGQTLDSYKDSVGIDMQDHLFQKGLMQIYNIALRGGNAQTKYSVSGALYDQTGIILNTGFKRYQGRVSIDQTISKKLKAGIDANYSKLLSYGQQVALGSTGDGQLTYSNNLFFSAWSYRPVANDSIDLLTLDDDPLYANDKLNPITALKNDYTRNGTSDLLGNAYINYAIANNLTLRIEGSIRSSINRDDEFYNSKTIRGRVYSLNVRGVNGSVNYNENKSWNNENTITYNKNFKNNNSITALAGFSMQGNESRENGFAVQNVPNEVLGISGLDQGTPYSITAAVSNNAMASFFGRLNYNYKSKYLLTATFRGDGSSKFSVGNRWGYFPSGAFAWNMDNEKFMKNFSWISNAKLRISYGLTGNNRVSDFAYLPQLNYSLAYAYSFDNATPTYGVVQTNLGNSNLKWETTGQLDIGYDLSLVNDRIEFTVDWYKKITKNLLLNAAMPITTGFTTAYKNIGEISNEGLEFSLNTINIKSRTFNWESNFNISFNKNKILGLTRGQDTLFSNVPFESEFSMPLYISAVGQPAGQFWGLLFNGVYQYSDFDKTTSGTYVLKSTIPTNGNVRNLIQPGDIKYKDLNGDGIVDSKDRTVIGRGQPIFVGGLNNNFKYKAFDLNVFFQWSYGNQIFNANRLLLEGNATQRPGVNQFASYSNRWTPDNQTNVNFRAGGQGPIAYSSRVIEDGSYLRLKTFSFGYSLPLRYIKKFSLSQLRINVSAQNLFTWTKYSGLDPEVSVRYSVLTPGFDFSPYPEPQSILFGLNATF
jgi:TonB-dependent starch-binding outer membrane protein SusC